jgi:hypothetical protein
MSLWKIERRKREKRKIKRIFVSTQERLNEKKEKGIKSCSYNDIEYMIVVLLWKQ